VNDTADPEYAERLERLGGASWKRILDVQRPYRWNLRRLDLGRTLDVGCGVGRNLRTLSVESIGVDHNRECVAAARARGLTAYTTDEFAAVSPGAFDSILIAHVLEHLSESDADNLLRSYLSLLKSGGKVVMITPQEAGFRSDSTHVRFVDFSGMRALADRMALVLLRQYSFPLPRFVGKVFPHNEFVTVCRSRS